MKLVAAALLALSLHAPAGTADAAQLKTTDITFTTQDGQQLGGRIFQPARPSGKLPGLVLIHGSGGGNSWQELKAEAEAFAKQGIVVLAPDKRSVGYTKTHRDYSQLADDALAAFAVLKKQPSVGRAGLWGISEGGWVAPIAADRAKDVEFLVTVGGPGLTPLRAQSWNAANKVDRAGVRGALRRTYSYTFHRLAADAGLFAAAHHDPVPYLARLKQPTLAMWGAADNQVPPAESAEQFRKHIKGNLTVRFFAGANHSLHPDIPGGMDMNALTPGYADAVGSWVRDVAAGNVPAPSADPYPAQVRTVETPPSSWWESWQLQVGAMLLMLLAFLGYAIRRLGPGSWPARVLALSGVLSLAGLTYTLFSMLFSSNWNGIATGPLLLGRPVAWLAAQLLAAVAAIATITCLAQWRTASARVRMISVAGVVFVPWALYWGLLIP